MRGHASFSVAAVHADPLSVLAEAVWVSRQAERPLPVCVTAYLWFCFHRFVWWWETAAPLGTNAWNWEATFRLFSINMLSLSLPQWWDELCWDTFSFRFSGFGTLVLSAAAFIFSCVPSVPVFLSFGMKRSSTVTSCLFVRCLSFLTFMHKASFSVGFSPQSLLTRLESPC